MRSKCTICNHDIQFLYRKKNVPVTFSPVSTDYKEDSIEDQDIFVCNTCGCVQLKHLIDPTILYNTSHNITYETPTWKEHHISFTNFVIENCKSKSILEVGGSSGVFYNLLQQSSNGYEYTCMDLCDPDPTSTIRFIKGNCETFEFKDTETIVMSHVFEHLYNPSIFVENISKHGVKNVFISIPNMSHLLSSNSPSIIFNEHTYFIDRVIIEWLFSKNGYSLTQSFQFKNHSLFFLFEKTPLEDKILLKNQPEIAAKMLEIHNTLENRFKMHEIPANSFFVPAGHMGQLFYTTVNPNKILGFLDNDPSKQGYRVYGTPYLVYSFNKLKEYQNEEIHIFIYGGPYTDELVTQIRSIHSTAIIHIV